MSSASEQRAAAVQYLPVAGRGERAPVSIYRHPLPIRIFHWLNALSFVLLLMSGLQIFNAYPRLHWGDVGYDGMPAIFEITGRGSLTIVRAGCRSARTGSTRRASSEFPRMPLLSV
jgi:hypothetical protein